MAGPQFKYDKETVELLFLIDKIRTTIEQTDIDKFAYFYVHGERGPDCLFAKVAYQRSNNDELLNNIMNLLEQALNVYNRKKTRSDT